MPQKYNKAVRDKIPEIIVEDGKKCKVVTLSDAEFLVELEKKLSEEIDEYLESRSKNELVDILEVAYRIGELKGITHSDLEKVRRDKVNDRGAFSKNFYLIEIS